MNKFNYIALTVALGLSGSLNANLKDPAICEMPYCCWINSYNYCVLGSNAENNNNINNQYKTETSCQANDFGDTMVGSCSLDSCEGVTPCVSSSHGSQKKRPTSQK